jgi:hypothetical protein
MLMMFGRVIVDMVDHLHGAAALAMAFQARVPQKTDARLFLGETTGTGLILAVSAGPRAAPVR